MAKGKQMTLKQAFEHLQTTEYKYSLAALKAAAKNGKLAAKYVDAPLPYYLVIEDDLMAWASDDSQHRAGRPAKGKE